jgi:protein involved in polysaccharide export with SLBB domain
VKTIILGFLACLIALCGCAGPKPKPELAASAAPPITLPERPAYRLGVGDRLDIRFIYNPTYNVNVVVRPDGVVTVPYVGEVNVDGMTPGDLQNLIQARYAEIVAAPDVAVIVDESASRQVMVFGEVRTPGAYDLRGPMTVLDVIASAGGVTYTGKKDSIVLIRRAQDGTFGGTKLNLDDILDGRGNNVMVMPRDVIYVPISSIGKVDIFVEQFMANITPAWFFFIEGKDVVNPKGTYIIGH